MPKSFHPAQLQKDLHLFAWVLLLRRFSYNGNPAAGKSQQQATDKQSDWWD